MSASFASALQAAREAAAAQHYPQGALYVVATPIGNLADITLRALHVLQLADTIACEDTRHTQTLLRAYGIDRPNGQLIALHQHNEAQAAQAVVERLRQGQRVAYASDAGTPGVSDPGARLAAAVQAAGLPLVPLPGASSVTAALSVAGAWAPGAQAGGFVFMGFLPTKAGERQAAAQRIAAEPAAVVLLEAPHRIEDLARALAPLGERPVTLGRELTKQFEEIATLPAHAIPAWLAAQPQRTRGEFVVVVHPAPPPAHGEEDGLRVLQLLLAELPVKTAVRLAAGITGAPRNGLYDAALRMQRGDAGGDAGEP
ncbi:16S rRNA (cytidine(1402)-2'-O)-methyltransferase [Ramlibacter sp. H39-3-26]|uniref:16S rRNA (cytidine(1402)-2'-O)-methyltransferase n=1 Tax=Curvibacter soli TaxID=3031331 RepID=UPI0023DA87B8|nr:16S rRNA (cytidine(1402)-2'-O)-methyltransferase [Ramlibacter sp. H39-3-26]MDF1485845.1 16S rRNA (cytidine(1402)-2'-O)-methyltransferase [Ramlibacter sp. H39-3-26]